LGLLEDEVSWIDWLEQVRPIPLPQLLWNDPNLSPPEVI
jgi:hypothetical protein